MSKYRQEEVINFLNESTHIKNRKKTEANTKENQNIFINSNIFAGSNNTFIIAEKHPYKTKSKFKQKVKHITEEQARHLHDLKDEIVQLEKLVRERSVSPQRVWMTFNKVMGIDNMHLLPAERFQEGEQYLQEWIDRLQWADRQKWLDNLYNDIGSLGDE